MDPDDKGPESTHDARATPFSARRGYVRTITLAMAVLVALVIVWYVVAEFLFL